MNLESWNRISGSPPLPTSLDRDDPIGVENYLTRVLQHAEITANSTYTRKGRTTNRFSKNQRRAFGSRLRWPGLEMDLHIDVGTQFTLQFQTGSYT